MKRILQCTALLILVLSASCGKKTNSGLSISANPSQPILITTSSAVNGVTTGPTAPYFTMNSMSITWSGSTTFQLLAFTFSTQQQSSSSSSTAYQCGGSGVTINYLFFSSTFKDNPTGCSGINGNPVLDANGNLTITMVNPTEGCTVTATSSGFWCDSLPIQISPNPFATYNVPVVVVVYGETLDKSGNATGRVNGTANITVH